MGVSTEIAAMATGTQTVRLLIEHRANSTCTVINLLVTLLKEEEEEEEEEEGQVFQFWNLLRLFFRRLGALESVRWGLFNFNRLQQDVLTSGCSGLVFYTVGSLLHQLRKLMRKITEQQDVACHESESNLLAEASLSRQIQYNFKQIKSQFFRQYYVFYTIYLLLR